MHGKEQCTRIALFFKNPLQNALPCVILPIELKNCYDEVSQLQQGFFRERRLWLGATQIPHTAFPFGAGRGIM